MGHRTVEDLFWARLMETADNLRDVAFWRLSAGTRAAMDEITGRQYRLLRLIYALTAKSAEGVSLKALADAQKLSSSAVSVMVDNLVQRGILERSPSPADRRMVLIRIGGRGLKIIRRFRVIFNEIAAEFLRRLSPEERDGFISQINHLCQYSSTIRKEKNE